MFQKLGELFLKSGKGVSETRKTVFLSFLLQLEKYALWQNQDSEAYLISHAAASHLT